MSDQEQVITEEQPNNIETITVMAGVITGTIKRVVLNVADGNTAKDALNGAGYSVDGDTQIYVNNERASADSVVADGDNVFIAKQISGN